jgi:acetoin:2,6-dichlorophenolindophenol oxidoreductase subunit alpha
VGGGIGLMTGAALAAQLDGDGRVAVCFFGDGAANQGVLTEALNLASLWRLPLVLVCENNGFSEFSPSATVTSGKIADRGRAFAIPCFEIDGNDVLAVWQAANSALRVARAGEGPSLIEARTYRTRGHVEYEATFLSEPYRDKAEVEIWKGKDPIPRFAAYLVGHRIAREEELATVAARIERQVADAAAIAEAAPWPEPSALRRDLMFA